ncbi:helix-turn-helix transcriptional regulator [Cognatishimia sp.]|uniref:helix-turn-helix transcriptional regulator n=1 Tax=Cognatishimia sp. TaxID=2211648 RepID=UPI0035184FB9
MKRTERLYALIEILKDGAVHRAEDLALRFDVSLRTMYRDMDMLAASGIPVEGERGRGYSSRAAITLPPLNLSEEELDALLVTLSAAGQSGDETLRTAARSLAEKIDAVLPEDHRAAPKSMNFAAYPFAESAYAFQHLTNLRGAIRTKQRIAIEMVSGANHTLRPLKLDYWGRVWSLTAWVEDLNDFGSFRVDQIETVKILPGLFVDEPGKTLADLDRRAS